MRSLVFKQIFVLRQICKLSFYKIFQGLTLLSIVQGSLRIGCVTCYILNRHAVGIFLSAVGNKNIERVNGVYIFLHLNITEMYAIFRKFHVTN